MRVSALGLGRALGLMAGAGLAVVAQAGVEEIVWVEVDNSVGTMGDTMGVPTGLDGVRTFDLYAVVTPGTMLFAADFGFVGWYRGYGDNMWTTQSVYQHEFGADVQSRFVGVEMIGAAVEFDTYLGLGMLDSKVVMNTTILGADWSPSGFTAAWYGAEFHGDSWISATGDADGRVFLARISVDSDGGYGDATGDAEWLGGRVFLSGEDGSGTFGQMDPESGLFVAPNAFPESAPSNIAGSNGGGSGEEAEVETLPDEILYDINGDGVVDMQDLLQLQQNLGMTDSQMDFNGDGIIDALDVEMMMELLATPGGIDLTGGSDDPTAGMTPKERKQYEKAQQKAEKLRLKEERQAAKAAEKERKRLEKERRKEEKRLEKERKQQEKRGGTL